VITRRTASAAETELALDAQCIGILCNPTAGSGRARIHELTRQAFECLGPQVTRVLVAPGDMGEVVCRGTNVEVVGQNQTRSRQDTIATVQQMVRQGAELLVIAAGDGTYNDALEGMQTIGRVVPIYGIAAGRFNTIYPKRKHDPFVSLRGDFRPFRLEDVIVEDVMGVRTSINGKVVSYAFFWAVICNLVAYTDAGGKFMTVDAAAYLSGQIVPLTAAPPVATEETRIRLVSQRLGEIEVGRGPRMSMPMVVQVTDEINQMSAAGFGGWANFMGYQGIVYYYTNPQITFLPSCEFFPVETRAVAFYAGDHVHLTGLNEGSVFQADSTAIAVVGPQDVLTAEVVMDLGQKAVLRSR